MERGKGTDTFPLPQECDKPHTTNTNYTAGGLGDNSNEVDDGDVREPLYVIEDEGNAEVHPKRLAVRQVRNSWFMLRKQMSEEEGIKTHKSNNTMSLLASERTGNVKKPAEDEKMLEVPEEDSSCGFGGWRPAFLQRCLSKKVYIVAYGVTGMCYFALGAYANATITTIEKRFKIPSRTTGLISCAWDIGSFMSVLAMGYIGMRGHKPRIVAVGSLIVAASCFLRLLPHIVYGPGQDALELTKEYGDSSVVVGNFSNESNRTASMCGSVLEPEDCEATGAATSLPAVILFISSILQGIGCSVYWTLGLTYLDDNISKNKAPMAHASSQFLRFLGPTIGFTIASYTLSKYVDPSLTPRIDNTDPRWIGAWWLGWGPLGCVVVLLAGMMTLFPRQLPRAAARRAERIRRNIVDIPPLSKNFFQAFSHMLRNRILVYNTMSAVCFILGNMGFWIFMPKYMETMYQQTSSRASLISGSIGLASAAVGLIVSGYVISRFKPRPRLVAGWNVVIEGLDVLFKLGWVFLDCGDRQLQGNWEENGTWNMTSECNVDCDCGPNVKYTPICSLAGNVSYFSPCHAGCNSSFEQLNGTTIYLNCACIPGGIAVEGPCVKDCVTNFTIFLVTNCLLSFLGASGKAGNILIQFRCVHEDDKPLAIAFSEFLMCGLAFIPAPIIFGVLLDTTCLVWGQTCGKSGNCWLYDDKKLRYLLNLTGSSLGVAGMLLDAGVCYHAKGLKIYDDDDEKIAVEVNGRQLEAVS